MSKIINLKDKLGNILYSKDILEQGTSDNGEQTYTKYSNGRLEILLKKTYINIEMTTLWGNVYEPKIGRHDLGKWVVPFKETPILSYSVNGPSGAGCVFVEDIRDTSNTDIGKINFCRPASTQGMTFTLNIIAIGKWK